MVTAAAIPISQSPLSDGRVAKPKTALISRGVDFWLLGGLSILALFLFVAIDKFFFPGILNNTHFFILLPILKICIEFPHLVASYRVAYSRGQSFVFRHWPITILMPAILILLIGALLLENQSFHWPSEVLIKWSAATIFFLFGWHRSMQAFGCMMVYSKFDDYQISRQQRLFLKWFLIIMWLFGYINLVRNSPNFSFYGLNVPMARVDDSFVLFADILMVAAWIGLGYFVIYKNIQTYRKLPSLNFLIAPLALFLWWSAFLWDWNFYLFLLPSCHSLQHLTFVFGSDELKPQVKLGGFGHLSKNSFLFIGLILASMALYFFPPLVFRQMSLVHNPEVMVGLVILFTSLHHYFLDGIIWKVSDSAFKEALLGKT